MEQIGLDMIVVVLYFILNWLDWKRKSKSIKIWREVGLRGVLPIAICSFWVYLTNSWYICLIIPIALIFIYLYCFSEWYLLDKFTALGYRQLIFNFDGNEPISDWWKIFKDSSGKTLNLGLTIEMSLKSRDKQEYEKFKVIIDSLNDYYLTQFVLNFCDWIGDDYYRIIEVLLIRKKPNEEMDKDFDADLIPKVVLMNCVCLTEYENVDGRKIKPVLAIEGIRDDVTLKTLKKFRVLFENVRMIPKFYQYENILRENEMLQEIVADLKVTIQEMVQYKGDINTFIKNTSGEK